MVSLEGRPARAAESAVDAAKAAYRFGERGLVEGAGRATCTAKRAGRSARRAVCSAGCALIDLEETGAVKPMMLISIRLSRSCLTVVLCAIAVGCKGKPKENAGAAQSDPNEVVVTTALAQNLKTGTPLMTDVTGTLQVAAHVETDASRIARVSSPVSGRILKLLVFEGEHVKPGTVLAMLHSTDLSDTQFALVKASSQQELAAAAERRAEQLVQADVIGQAELERRKAELLQASTEAASYQTQLRGLGMTETQIKQLETTRKLSADYPIVTPKGGTVLKREITIG